MSYTVDEHISRHWSLAIFDFQVSVGALVLSSFIDSCIGDPQCCAEESRSTAVCGGEASACRRGRPPQVLPTSGSRGFSMNTVYVWVNSMRYIYTYLHVSSRLSDLFILWTPWMFSVGGSGINRSSMAAGNNNTQQSRHRLTTITINGDDISLYGPNKYRGPHTGVRGHVAIVTKKTHCVARINVLMEIKCRSKAQGWN